MLHARAVVFFATCRAVARRSPKFLFAYHGCFFEPRSPRLAACVVAALVALVALPGGSGFVRFGGGYKAGEARWEPRQFDCAYIGGMVQAHMDLARRWEVEHPDAEDDYFTTQAALRIAADLLLVEKQIIYGWGNDALGFPGLKQTAPGTLAANVYSLTETPDDTDFTKSVINAGGTQAGTASSVYAWIDGEMDCQLVLGDDMGGQAELFRLSEMVTSNEAPDSNEPTKKSLHDLQQFSGHLGLSVAGFNQSPNNVVPTQHSVRRLANLTTDTAAKLNDAMMSKLSRSFGVGKRPNHFAMATRSGEYLAASRAPTAINFLMGQSGDAQNATFTTYPPPPENWNGIPIHYADNTIGESDAVEA
jgi:hypothetical protein